MAEQKQSVRLAAIGDVHCGLNSAGEFRALFAQANDRADVLLLLGDLTNYGHPGEIKVLIKELAGIKTPILAVLGNHEYETDHQDEIAALLTDAGVIVLDGQAHELFGVGFAGVKGFCGGFGTRALEPWGEKVIKAFVQEALDETLKLETALARLRTKKRVALLHYAPCQSTVEGEPPEIYCFLGTSRLEEPLNRYEVSAVFHGHAHRGQAEGTTRTGIPVYNVALPIFRKANPESPELKIVEISVE